MTSWIYEQRSSIKNKYVLRALIVQRGALRMYLTEKCT